MPKEEQGVFQDRYQVIPRTLIFIRDGDKVLLLKGAPDKRLWANRYNGIGGHIERGEDPLSSAKRELREETGLEISPLKLRGIVMVDVDENIGIGIYIFLGDYQGGAITPSKEGVLEWVPIKDLAQTPLVEDLYEVLPKIFALKDNEPPLSMLYSYNTNGCMRVVIAENR